MTRDSGRGYRGTSFELSVAALGPIPDAFSVLEVSVLGQKESSTPSIMCSYSPFHRCGEKKNGPNVVARSSYFQGLALISKIGFRNPSLRPTQKLITGFPKRLFPERFVRTPTGNDPRPR